MGDFKRILLVEDDPKDIQLTLTALGKHNLANKIVVVRDGVEALDYMYRREAFADRPEGNPVVILLDLKNAEVKWNSGTAATKIRHENANGSNCYTYLLARRT
jgi:CheY-like chemotaxis protein